MLVLCTAVQARAQLIKYQLLMEVIIMRMIHAYFIRQSRRAVGIADSRQYILATGLGGTMHMGTVMQYRITVTVGSNIGVSDHRQCCRGATCRITVKKHR